MDGYAGYNKLQDVILVRCFTHARRKFTDAYKALGIKDQKADVASKKGIDFCNELYHVEHKLAEMTPNERYEERLKQSVPILEEFKKWLLWHKSRLMPKSSFGKAVLYCLNLWDELTNYLKDGRLEIDNNRAERSVKNYVIGRKNWLFSNTPRGAKGSATIYSIVETAKENGLNVPKYICWLLEKMPNMDIADETVLDSLLPWSPGIPDDCKLKKR